jgi:nucleoside-diphosphate-sugar epimerase
MILVTGGTGMAGSFIVRELQSRGQAVRVLARPSAEQIARDLGVELALGDLADIDSVQRAAQGASGIVHVACTFTQPDVDIAAMQALLGQWDTGPFVFISSTDVYGYAQELPVTEAHPLDPAYSSYGGGKVSCEALLQAAAAARGRQDFSILRPPHIWGPHRKCRERLVNARMLANQPVVLPGATPEEWMQFGDEWVDTRELAWATAECLTRPLGGAANAITSHFLWHEVYAELIRLAGSSSVIEHKALDAITEEELPNKSFYAQTWHFSGEYLEQHLGFRPAHRWQDTLAEIVSSAEQTR